MLRWFAATLVAVARVLPRRTLERHPGHRPLAQSSSRSLTSMRRSSSRSTRPTPRQRRFSRCGELRGCRGGDPAAPRARHSRPDRDDRRGRRALRSRAALRAASQPRRARRGPRRARGRAPGAGRERAPRYRARAERHASRADADGGRRLSASVRADGGERRHGRPTSASATSCSRLPGARRVPRPSRHPAARRATSSGTSGERELRPSRSGGTHRPPDREGSARRSREDAPHSRLGPSRRRRPQERDAPRHPRRLPLEVPVAASCGEPTPTCRGSGRSSATACRSPCSGATASRTPCSTGDSVEALAGAAAVALPVASDLPGTPRQAPSRPPSRHPRKRRRRGGRPRRRRRLLADRNARAPYRAVRPDTLVDGGRALGDARTLPRALARRPARSSPGATSTRWTMWWISPTCWRRCRDGGRRSLSAASPRRSPPHL